MKIYTPPIDLSSFVTSSQLSAQFAEKAAGESILPIPQPQSPPAGVIITASSSVNGYGPEKAFDGLLSGQNFWAHSFTAPTVQSPAVLTIEYLEPVFIEGYSIVRYGIATQSPVSWFVETSVDGITWVLRKTVANEPVSTARINEYWNRPLRPERFIRLSITDVGAFNPGGNFAGVYEFKGIQNPASTLADSYTQIYRDLFPGQIEASLSAAARESATLKRLVKIAPGNYNLSGFVDLAPGHNLDLTGCVFTRTVASAGFRIRGSIVAGATATLSANLQNANRPQSAANTPTLLTKAFTAATPVGTFAVDDWIMLYSNATVSVSTTDGVPGLRGSIRRVIAVDAAGLTIRPLWWDAQTSDNARIQKLNMVQGGRILGGEFLDAVGLRTTANLPPMVQAAYAIGQVVEQSYLHDLGGKGIVFDHCFESYADAIRVDNLPDNEPGGLFGYGVAVGGGSIKCGVKNSTMTRCRHGFTTDRPFVGDVLDTIGQPEQWYADNLDVRQCTNNGIDAHKEGWLGKITNCRASDGYIGIAVRAPRTMIEGCTTQNCLLYGIWVTSWAPDCEVVNCKTLYTIRDVPNNLGGFGIQTNAARTTIRGNTGAGNQTGDILLNSVDGCLANFNEIRSDNGITVGGTASNTTLQGNLGKQTSSGFFIEAQANTTNLVLQLNVNRGTGTYLLSSPANQRTQIGNTGLLDTFPVNGVRISDTLTQWVWSSASNPTTRPDGTALVAGDRIIDTLYNRVWSWTGLLWVTTDEQQNSFLNTLSSGSGANTVFDTPANSDVLIKEVTLSFFGSNVTTASGVTVQAVIRSLGPTTSILFNQTVPNGTSFVTNERYAYKWPVNVTVPVKTLNSNSAGVGLFVSSTLGVSLASFSQGIRYSLVR